MSSRTAAVMDLKKTFDEVLRKQAMMPVPPHPDFAPPPQGPPPPGAGAPPEQAIPPGAPPQGAPPADPGAMQQGAPPADPGAPAPQGGTPAVSSEMAAMMEKVIQAVEGQSAALAEYRKQQEERMNRLEAELAQDKAVREERKKLIHSIVPTL